MTLESVLSSTKGDEGFPLFITDIDDVSPHFKGDSCSPDGTESKSLHLIKGPYFPLQRIFVGFLRRQVASVATVEKQRQQQKQHSNCVLSCILIINTMPVFGPEAGLH